MLEASSLIDTYKEMVQKKIDNGETLSLATFTTFTESVRRYCETQERLVGSKQLIENMLVFLEKIILKDSRIIEHTVPSYAESFTIEALTSISDTEVPLRFTLAADVYNVEYYALSFKIPDEASLSAHVLRELSFFDTFFKDRWLTCALFDYNDTLLGPLKTGFTLSGYIDRHALQEHFPASMRVVEYCIDVPLIRFSAELPLDTLSFIPFFATGIMPLGTTAEKLQSMIIFKAELEVNKSLYANTAARESGIESMVLEAIELGLRWGVPTPHKLTAVETVGSMSFFVGTVTRLRCNPGSTDLIARGALEIRPTGPMLVSSLEGTWNHPFGIRWLTLKNVGFEFPLRPGGAIISGIGMRAQAIFGGVAIECAGKSSVGILQKTGLLLHGKIETLPLATFFKAFGVKNNDTTWDAVRLDHAQVTLAMGNVVVAGREFKSGLVVRAQVGDSLLDKKAGFELFAYDTGSYYQLFGNGYLPKIETPYFTFERAEVVSAYPSPVKAVGPRLEFEYSYDPLLKKAPLIALRANGRIRIDSLFDGTADIDISSARIINSDLRHLKTFIIALLKKQRVVLRGMLFNTFGAQLEILDSSDDDVLVKVGVSHQLMRSWERYTREVVFSMKQQFQEQLNAVQKKIDALVEGMNMQAKESLLRASQLADENKKLTKEIADLAALRKKLSWLQPAKAMSLGGQQTAKWVTVRSNGEMLNTLLMHGAFKESVADSFAALSRIKNALEAFINTIEGGATLGAGILGIEKIEGQTWVRKLLTGQPALSLTIEMRVMGEKRVLSDIPLRVGDPVGSFKEVIKRFLQETFTV
jgi:hypothetical protein